MTNEVFNVFSAIGIGLTFLASIAAIVVSIISLKSSNKSAKHSAYLNTITTSREKWQTDMRENATLYFTQIARLCNGQEDNLSDIYNELTKYHFAITLLLFKQDKEIHDNMSAVRNLALEVVSQNNIILHYQTKCKQNSKFLTCKQPQDAIDHANKKMNDLRIAIINNYQSRIFNELRDMIEWEWRKQQYEATDMWKQK